MFHCRIEELSSNDQSDSKDESEPTYRIDVEIKAGAQNSESGQEMQAQVALLLKSGPYPMKGVVKRLDHRCRPACLPFPGVGNAEGSKN